MSDRIEPPFISDEPLPETARPCEHAEGCRLPGRFAIGIDQGAMRYWCVDHTDEGIAYFRTLVRGIRESIGRG